MPTPNSGKLNKLISQLNRRTIQLGVYKNVVTPTDGSLTAYSLTEMPTGGGRGYAPLELKRAINLSALAADQWYIALNSSGKGQAQYSNLPLQFTMTSVDVADGNTPQGSFGYCWFLPFQTGAVEIKVGDIIKGATSGASAVVTDVLLLSGTWAGGNAAGYLYLETKTGTFQNGENLTRSGAVATATISNSGVNYVVGDIVSLVQGAGAGGKGIVLDVDSYGGVTDLEIVDGGQGYTVAAATTAGGTGAGLALTIATLATTVYAVSNSGTVNGGDAQKDLMYLSAIATPVQITTVGQSISITPILTEDTDPTVG
jgi:hypothetical protein